MGCSPLGSSVPGILQVRILERIAIPFYRRSQLRDPTQVSCITGGFFTVWATREAQEYWSGLPFSSPGDLPNLGIELGSPALEGGVFFFKPLSHLGSPQGNLTYLINKMFLSPIVMLINLINQNVVQMVKHLSTVWETWVRSLGWEDPLEKEMATHSSTLAWKI